MAAASNSIRRARPLLGTFVEVEAAAASVPEAHAAIDAAFAAIADVHRLMSFHDPDSDVGRLNRSALVGPVEVHDWTFAVLRAAAELRAASDGVFDITVAPALQALGLLPRPANDAARVSAARSRGAVELLPDRRVRFRSAGMGIDLGGIAKGFAVDRALDAMRRFDVAGGMVNAGGDLAAFGGAPQTIHLRDPRAPQRVIGSIAVRDEALASSARRFDPFHAAATTGAAIIDPASARPADRILGATVRAPSCMIADALTKIVMIAGHGAGSLLQRYGAGALFVAGDGELHVTPNLQRALHLAA